MLKNALKKKFGDSTMNSDESQENELEKQFQNPLSFLEEIGEEISQEENEIEELYQTVLGQLPIIDTFYSQREESFSGGMKKIELAWDNSASRKVALAWPISDDMSLKDKVIFLNEARISSTLEHPNIIPVYQVGQSLQGIPLFVMKWLDGITLEKYLSNQSSSDKEESLQELLAILIKVCEAIEYAHARGVMHLDLKPGNIQLGNFGEVLVLDWGLARLANTDNLKEDEIKVHENLELFLKTRLRGTPNYIAPEYKNGEPLSPSMDIFSLGVITKDILQYLEKDFSVFQLSSLKSIATKALSENPINRYPSVTQLKKDLQDFLLGYAVTAENPSLLKVTHLFFKRNKAVCSAILLSFFLLTISSIIFIFNLRKSEAKTLIALSELEQENALKNTLLEQLSVHVDEVQRSNQNNLDFQKAIENLEYLTALDSKNANVWHQLARLKVGTLNFEDALKCIEKIEELGINPNKRTDVFKAKAEKYRHVDTWNQEMYLDFYSEHPIEYLQASFCSTIYPTMKPEEKIDFFEKAIKLRNSKLFNLKLSFKENLLYVDLSSNKNQLNFSAASGLPIHHLNLNGTENNALTFFQASNLYSLDISNSHFYDFLSITTLNELIAKNLNNVELQGEIEFWNNLYKLDFSGSQLKSWTFLRHCINLSELNISNSNFSFEGLRGFPQLQTLIISSDLEIPKSKNKQLQKNETKLIIQ